MKPLLLVGLFCVFLVAADKPYDVKQTRESLQGTWQMREQYLGDTDMSEDAKHCQLIIDGDKFTVKQDQNTIIEGTFQIIPDKSPPQADWKVLKEEGQPDHSGKTSLGIFQLEGDKLKLCATEPGETKRPTDFSVKGTSFMLVVLERAKK